MEDTPTAGEPASQPDPPETPSPSVLKPILIISAVIIGLCAGCVTLFSAVGDDDPIGAKVRSRWTCIATHEGDTTSLVDITVDG